ncbi:DegT/DnrJ/EryC1/StrS family aminotransferase [Pleomorphovibrio marinus]|uniref:DegT/DnrJ/EryC1/StrS family aminotransferase n=1 Tax=Pleomorphovibrio marinus TaxID=2164132 RepID=UPI000E0C0E86|nr:DegT/DnrJ/EryC1/StrS family aminotransferase [Pleomorphovibrio marinus]
MIPVTRPFSPPIEEYHELLQGIWQRSWFTNNGPLVNDLELKLKRYLGIKHLLYLGNGTIAIQIALKALKIDKEVITTPFSYVATTSSLVWEGCTPVYVDIHPESLNIDPTKIEVAITKNTQAILATHCFGNPCDVEAIQEIADKYGLKVIYDAAHCFGTKYKGESIFRWGDISTTSFHATKLFHTVEGGAVFTKNPELLRVMAYKRNFGHKGFEDFHGVGINGKNSEFHAAMGLVNLKYIGSILERRKKQSLFYDKYLGSQEFQKVQIQHGSEFNYAYYPLRFESEAVTKKVKQSLESAEIFPRRYFYPSLGTLNYVSPPCTPIADENSARILCLPLYHDLSEMEQKLICRKILRTINYNS